MRRNNSLIHPVFCLIASGLMVQSASAIDLSHGENYALNADLEIMGGFFNSSKNYAADTDVGGAFWQEGYVKYGLSGHYILGADITAYGGVSGVSSGTAGDGDAAGFTTGDEAKTTLEDAFIGFKSGSALPFLGYDGLDVSLGSQNFSIGDGFLIQGDALNLGEGLNGGGFDFDRGGAYWIAARKAFNKTAVMRVGGDTGLRSDLFWLESNNKAQAETELAGINLEYVTDYGTFGLMHLKGLGVNERYAQALGLTSRDGQKTTSVRYQGSAGVEQLFLSAEFVSQSQGDSTRDDSNAWYAEAGWTFDKVTWSPSVNVRYTAYDEQFDPLFFGFSRGYGTWFQGEVAANYAGPFGTDSDIIHVGVKAHPTPAVSVGALFFDFNDTGNGSGALDGQELDMYAEWGVTENLFLSPLIGFYTPDNSASSGGSQLQDDDMNIYAQIMGVIAF